jgi:hypothetical protein
MTNRERCSMQAGVESGIAPATKILPTPRLGKFRLSMTSSDVRRRIYTVGRTRQIRIESGVRGPFLRARMSRLLALG